MKAGAQSGHHRIADIRRPVRAEVLKVNGFRIDGDRLDRHQPETLVEALEVLELQELEGMDWS